MTPATEIFPREHGRDLSHLFRAITDVIKECNIEAICHDLSDREVLGIWAKGDLEINETNATVAKMARLGRD